MRKFLFAVLFLFSCTSPHKTGTPLASSSVMEISAEALRAADFIYHQAKTPFGSYLALNLEFKPYNDLRLLLEKELGVTLIHRGEAHITVISPIEFDQVLSRKISIDKINTLALKLNLQKSGFRLHCVGRGEAKVNEKFEKTYYVVVESKDLFEIRKKIHSAFIQAGGDPKKFDPMNYYPHVTLGFTLKDLHYEDGIVKDAKSCIYPLKTIN